MSKKQPIVTLSTTETEFVAAVASACQAVWMRRVLRNLNHGQESSTVIMCDNSSTIKLSKKPSNARNEQTYQSWISFFKRSCKGWRN